MKKIIIFLTVGLMMISGIRAANAETVQQKITKLYIQVYLLEVQQLQQALAALQVAPVVVTIPAVTPSPVIQSGGGGPAFTPVVVIDDVVPVTPDQTSTVTVASDTPDPIVSSFTLADASSSDPIATSTASSTDENATTTAPEPNGADACQAAAADPNNIDLRLGWTPTMYAECAALASSTASSTD